MSSQDTLFAFLGHADLRAAREQASADRFDSKQCGPVVAALCAWKTPELQITEPSPPEFNKIVLLWVGDYDPDKHVSPRTYEKWLKKLKSDGVLPARLKISLQTFLARDSKPADPTRHDFLMTCAESAVRNELNAGLKRRDCWFHLSPGTPAAHAVWVFLAQSRFYPARMIQTSIENGFEVVRLNVRITLADVAARSTTPELDDRIYSLIHGSSYVGCISKNEFKAIVRSRDGQIERLVRKAVLIANSSLHVHITGETGTGKELFAAAIHAASPRREKAFRTISCANIPRDLVESELFGHKQGAFTGATSDKKGLVELADQGTLFLDEIGELDPRVQAKLLRFLENGTFTVVGSTEERSANIRLVTATHRSLQEMVQAGHFRDDLYFRIVGAVLHVPSLRERGRDLDQLIDHFLGDSTQIDEEARQEFNAYSWPGNVRQLKNVVQLAKVYGRQDVDRCLIDKFAAIEALSDLAPIGGAHGSKIDGFDGELEDPTVASMLTKLGLTPLPEPELSATVDLASILTKIEFCYMKRAVALTDGNRSAASRLLQLDNQGQSGGTKITKTFGAHASDAWAIELDPKS